MKKAVVYLLTSVVVCGSCLSPLTAYAESNTTKQVSEEKSEDSSESAEDDSGGAKMSKSDVDQSDDKKSTDDSESKENDKESETQSNEDTSKDTQKSEETKETEDSKETEKSEESKETEKSEESKDEEKSEESKEDEKTEDAENKDENKEVVAPKANDNLDGLKGYLRTLTNGDVSSGRYMTDKSVVVIAYHDKTFLYPLIDKAGIPQMFFYTNVKDEDKVNVVDGEEYPVYNKVPNTIEGVYSLEDVTAYLKGLDSKKLSEYTVTSKEGVFDLDGELEDQDYTLLVYDAETLNYVGSMSTKTLDARNALYDKSILSSSIDASVSYSDDKKTAYISFKFKSNVPAVLTDFLGKDLITSYSVTKDGESVFDYSELFEYMNSEDGGNVTEIKKMPVTSNGDYVIEVDGSLTSAKCTVTVDGITKWEETSNENAKTPKVTFGDLESGILDGTPIAVTMYSDIDAVLMFNGESSINATKEYSFTVSHNGSYEWHAITESGEEVSGVFEVDCFVDEAESINLGAYGSGGNTVLPQTGGISTLMAVMSGLLLMVGGTLIAKKEALMTLVSKLGRRS